MRMTRLEDGRVAWYQARADDCLRPALATLLQVLPEDLPDPEIDKCLANGMDPEDVNRLAHSELQAYLAGYGLRAVFHSSPPADRHCWIGISPGDGRSRFGDHCVVMDGEDIVHDPAEGFPTPAGTKVAPTEEITRGITLEEIAQ